MKTARGPAPVELTVDCSRCGLEAGVVETYDALVPACRFGLPASSRCRLCAVSAEGIFTAAPKIAMSDVPANACPACLALLPPAALDERRCANCSAEALVRDVSPARAFATEVDLVTALDEWAAREGHSSRQALLDATFCEPDVEAIFRHLVKREPLAVIADPFGTHRTRAASDPAIPSAERERPAHPASGPRSERAPLSAPPRAIVYPLVSVIAADGEVHPEERRLVDRFLESEGLAPLADSEFCVHHPSSVAHLVPKERREHVVQLMCETAAIDGMPDESERKIIRAYAAAWHVPDEKTEFWLWGYESMNTSLTRQLWLKIRSFVLSARWSSDHKESL